MPRPAACFRKEGLIVVPAPSYCRDSRAFPQEFMPSWKAIYHNEVTMHEVVRPDGIGCMGGSDLN